MLVGLKEILALAQAGGYAIPAFNVYNMETVIGCITAAEDLHAPVILQTYSRLFKEGSGYYLAPSVLAAAKRRRCQYAFIWIMAHRNWRPLAHCDMAAQA